MSENRIISLERWLQASAHDIYIMSVEVWKNDKCINFWLHSVSNCQKSYISNKLLKPQLCSELIDSIPDDTLWKKPGKNIMENTENNSKYIVKKN